jgi:hypothetical protein
VAEPLQRLALQARAIRRFEFLEETPLRSRISEVAALDEAVASMRRSIRRFVEMTGALAEENDFERLQQTLLRHALPAVDARLGVLYLEEQGRLLPRCALRQDQQPLTDALPELQACASVELVQQALDADWTLGGALHEADLQQLGLAQTGLQLGGAIVVPLHNRKRERIGALLLLCEAEPLPSRVRFAEAVAASAATAIETRELIRAQKQLFEAFIQLIAGAIDAKSPYTGGHCARVPELTKMLARAACDATRRAVCRNFQPGRRRLGGRAHRRLAARLRQGHHPGVCGGQGHQAGSHPRPHPRDPHALRGAQARRGDRLLAGRGRGRRPRHRAGHPGGKPGCPRRGVRLRRRAATCRWRAPWTQADVAAPAAHCRNARWLRTLDDRLGVSHEVLRGACSHRQRPLPQWEALINDAP